MASSEEEADTIPQDSLCPLLPPRLAGGRRVVELEVGGAEAPMVTTPTTQASVMGGRKKYEESKRELVERHLTNSGKEPHISPSLTARGGGSPGNMHS